MSGSVASDDGAAHRSAAELSGSQHSAHEVGKANTIVELSSATLGRYVGAYEFRGGSAGVAGFMGSTQTVALIDGTLYMNALPLIPQSETRFDSTGAAAEFTIDTNDMFDFGSDRRRRDIRSQAVSLGQSGA